MIEEIANTLGIIGAITSFAHATWAFRKSKQAMARISIVIEAVDKKIYAFTLLRRDTARAEVLGRLGMLPMKKPGARFSLGNLNSPTFMAQLDAVALGNSNVITITATADEINQFDL